MIRVVNEHNLDRACCELAGRDADLAFIYDSCGTPPLWRRAPSFATLVHIILEQQVSLASALAAYKKLEERLGGRVTPAGVLSLTDEELKAAYFSRQKTVYARELARAVTEGALDLAALEALPDETVREQLKKIKGIGDWTADIYLLMALLRADVMPKGDLALHLAYKKLKNAERPPASAEFQLIAERWRPHRAAAARLLWHYYLSTGKKRKV